MGLIHPTRGINCEREEIFREKTHGNLQGRVGVIAGDGLSDQIGIIHCRFHKTGYGLKAEANDFGGGVEGGSSEAAGDLKRGLSLRRRPIGGEIDATAGGDVFPGGAEADLMGRRIKRGI